MPTPAYTCGALLLPSSFPLRPKLLGFRPSLLRPPQVMTKPGLEMIHAQCALAPSLPQN
jgi:hypothetical protein